MNPIPTIFLLKLAILFLLIGESVAQNGNKSAIGEIRMVQGVTTVHKKDGALSPIGQGFEIGVMDSIITHEDGYLSFTFNGRSIIHMHPGSKITFHQTDHINQSELRAKVHRGEILVEAVQTNQLLHIITPTAVGVTENAIYKIQITENGSTTFTAIHGNVEITAAESGETQMLARRNRLKTDLRGQFFTVQHISNREVDNVKVMFNRFRMPTETAPGH